MFDYELEHVFSYAVTLAEPEVVGPVPAGVRANLYATGGEVTGPKLRLVGTVSGVTDTVGGATGNLLGAERRKAGEGRAPTTDVRREGRDL